ncbi:MAG: hypothetical protein KBF68_07400 [Nitrosomonas sp.]|nr:hypothetical protein [Nitrosomonas sp.]
MMTDLEPILWGAILFLLGLLTSSYLPSYTKEKAKNLATKEDIAEITKRVESVRADFSKESQLLEKRREVYERISDSLRIFIDGHHNCSQQQNAFHSAYSACWLWAPDEVLIKLNKFIEMQKNNAANGNEMHSQEELKQIYCEIILSMRRDVGFSETTIDKETYAFVKF